MGSQGKPDTREQSLQRFIVRVGRITRHERLAFLNGYQAAYRAGLERAAEIVCGGCKSGKPLTKNVHLDTFNGQTSLCRAAAIRAECERVKAEEGR